MDGQNPAHLRKPQIPLSIPTKAMVSTMESLASVLPGTLVFFVSFGPLDRETAEEAFSPAAGRPSNS